MKGCDALLAIHSEHVFRTIQFEGIDQLILILPIARLKILLRWLVETSLPFLTIVFPQIAHGLLILVHSTHHLKRLILDDLPLLPLHFRIFVALNDLYLVMDTLLPRYDLV